MGDFAPEVKKILREHGCQFVRQGKGDHEMWKSPINGKSFPVDYKIKSRQRDGEKVLAAFPTRTDKEEISARRQREKTYKEQRR